MRQKYKSKKYKYRYGSYWEEEWVLLDEDGEIITDKIWNCPIYHREDGPALTRITENNINVVISEWYYLGEHIDCSSQEEFLKLLNLRAFW